MILDLITYPDPLLKEKSKPVKKVTDTERKLFNDMIYTMYAKKGIGLAAVQVGVLKQMLVIDIGKQNIIKIANPQIIAQKGTACIAEGCLSVPDQNIKVERFSDIVVRGLDANSREITILLSGLEAIAMQHEMDHLIGKTIMDYK